MLKPISRLRPAPPGFVAYLISNCCKIIKEEDIKLICYQWFKPLPSEPEDWQEG